MAQNVLSITQLNEYIRSRMDADPLLTQVAVRGEISNYKLYPSGHHYFTLKDENAALNAENADLNEQLDALIVEVLEGGAVDVSETEETV